MASANFTKLITTVLFVLMLVISLALLYTLLPLIFVVAGAFGIFSNEPHSGGISAAAGGTSNNLAIKALFLVIAFIFIIFFLRKRSRGIRLP